jgi:hypothetical protein
LQAACVRLYIALPRKRPAEKTGRLRRKDFTLIERPKYTLQEAAPVLTRKTICKHYATSFASGAICAGKRYGPKA